MTVNPDKKLYYMTETLFTSGNGGGDAIILVSVFSYPSFWSYGELYAFMFHAFFRVYDSKLVADIYTSKTQ